MMIAADESLACSRLQRLSGKALVMYYKRDVPIKPIIDHLREREGSVVRDQVERIRVEGGAEGLSFTGDVVSIEDVARQRGVSEASMKLALQSFTPEGYVRVGDRLFVSKGKLDEIEGKLRGVETLSEALFPKDADVPSKRAQRISRLDLRELIPSPEASVAPRRATGLSRRNLLQVDSSGRSHH